MNTHTNMDVQSERSLKVPVCAEGPGLVSVGREQTSLASFGVQ